MHFIHIKLNNNRSKLLHYKHNFMTDQIHFYGLIQMIINC